MSTLGIDVGTTGCKAGVVDAGGNVLALAYREYPVQHPQPGWAEFDSRAVWGKIKDVIREAIAAAPHDPPVALCVTSLGEAMTPVSANREILGNSILGFDARGQEYMAALTQRPGQARLHELNGNMLTWQNTAPKLQWLRDHCPDEFQGAYKYLLWGGLVGYLLGGDATSDPSLASRTLLMDLHTTDWSDELLDAAGLPRNKFPRIVPSGAVIGEVDGRIAAELGLRKGVKIVAGGHDQCCTALGAGVVETGQAVYGMGTYICVTPVYSTPPPSSVMLQYGLNVEHHVVPGLYASFLFNLTGGAVLRWIRDTLAQAEKAQAVAEGVDIYDRLLAEMPAEPTNLMVLPHFAPCGPPTFDERSSGAILGLKLETSRGELVKGILEGTTYYFKEGLDLIEQAGLPVHEYRATGGGAKGDAWLQLTADILGQPICRLAVSECGVLGAAILAGAGAGVFSSAAETAKQVVRVTRVFEPQPERYDIYQERMGRYKELYPLLKDYLHRM